MKTRKIFLIAAFACSLFSCKTISQLAAFTNCKYDFSGLSNPTIAGVSLSGLQDVTKLNATSLLKVTTGIMSGNLPLGAVVNVKATNPNATTAQIAGLDWAIDLESKTLLTGTINQQVTVPANGGTTVIPLSFQMNVMEVLKGESKDNILKFVNNMLNAGESSSTVSIRVKPTISVGGRNISTNFITLQKKI